MKTATIQRWGGISMIAGSLLYIFWAVGYAVLLPLQDFTGDLTILIMSPHWIWTCSAALCATLLMTLGFTAVYSRLCGSSGVVGFVGYVFLFLAFVVQTSGLTWEVFLYPVIADHEPSVALFRDGILQQSALIAVYSTAFYADGYRDYPFHTGDHQEPRVPDLVRRVVFRRGTYVCCRRFVESIPLRGRCRRSVRRLSGAGEKDGVAGNGIGQVRRQWSRLR